MKSLSSWCVVVVCLAVFAPMANAAACPANLPAGVVLRVYPDEKLSAGVSSGPTIFTVGSDVRFFPNRPPLLARGSKVLANIVESKQAGRLRGRAQMRIALTSILTADFCEYPIDSRIVEVARHTVKNDVILGRGHGKRDVVALLFPPTTLYQLLRIPGRGPKLELSTETPLTIKLLQPLSLAAVSSEQSEGDRLSALRTRFDPSQRESVGNTVSGPCAAMPATLPARPLVRRTTIERPVRNLTPYHVSVYIDRIPVAIVPPCYGGSMITTPINEFTLEAVASLLTTGGQKQVTVKMVPTTGGGWDIMPDAAELVLAGATAN